MRFFFRPVVVLLLLLVASGADAQRVDRRLTELVEKTTKRRVQGQLPVIGRNASKVMNVEFGEDGNIATLSAMAFLNEGAVCPTERLEQMGIKVRYVLGDMAALTIPADKLAALEDVEEFNFVKADLKKKVNNNIARNFTGVNSVNTYEGAKAVELPKAFTGAGVVLGIIDQGIDYQHAAFRDENGKTRIKMIIDYSKDTKKMTKYTDEEDIIDIICDTDNDSHGTHVAGIAGGSYTTNDSIHGLQGMAPQADLVLCGLGEANTATNIVYCMKSIFEYAESVNKPAVINISMGSLVGLHDGSEEIPKAVTILTENGTKAGRAVVIGAGNSAGNWQSIYTNLPENDIVEGYKLMTILGSKEYPSDDDPDLKVTYTGNYCFYSAYDEGLDFNFDLVNITNGKSVKWGSHVRKVEDNSVVTADKIGEWYTTTTISGRKKQYFGMFLKSDPIYIDNADLRIALFVTGKTKDLVTLLCDGEDYLEPCFDAPADMGYDFKEEGFTKGWSDMSCSTDICNDYVISVGSYICRNTWTNDIGETSHLPISRFTHKLQNLGEISDFSGYAIFDDNNKPRPTVLAPGEYIISAVSNYDNTLFLTDQPGVKNPDKKDDTKDLYGKTEKNGRTNWYKLERGTSMATPVVSGIIALWMQANPNLSVMDIIDIMSETCQDDDFTTQTEMIPSHRLQQAGLGKIDCLAGLKKILGTTGIETINMDQRREATPATMYSVDAPVYNMMGQRVSKSHQGIVIYKGRKYLNK